MTAPAPPAPRPQPPTRLAYVSGFQPSSRVNRPLPIRASNDVAKIEISITRITSSAERSAVRFSQITDGIRRPANVRLIHEITAVHTGGRFGSSPTGRSRTNSGSMMIATRIAVWTISAPRSDVHALTCDRPAPPLAPPTYFDAYISPFARPRSA